MKVGTRVRVAFPQKSGAKYGRIISKRFQEAGVWWYWIDFGYMSYIVPENELTEVTMEEYG